MTEFFSNSEACTSEQIASQEKTSEKNISWNALDANDVFSTGKSSFIKHTSAHYIVPIFSYVNDLCLEFFSLKSQHLKKIYDKMAQIYWWLAHACPDLRGSAAKTEIFCRALCHARGIYLPLWKEHIAPDLECMLRSEQEWLNDYSDLLRKSIT